MRKVKSGLIQVSLPMTEGEGTIPEIMEAMVKKHIPFIEEAGKQGVQILCFQEIFNTPYLKVINKYIISFSFYKFTLIIIYIIINSPHKTLFVCIFNE